MHVVLVDGRELSVPLAWFPRLAAASVEQRRGFELLDQGVELRWEEIDEDISVPNLLGVPYENSRAGVADLESRAPAGRVR
jgi:hypothetical protein